LLICASLINILLIEMCFSNDGLRRIRSF
jgi:hypothetical protein